jgi:hypothetical protein
MTKKNEYPHIQERAAAKNKNGSEIQKKSITINSIE